MAPVTLSTDFETKFQTLKEKHKNGIIVGLKEFGGVIPRQDIDVIMVKEPKMFNLMTLALRALKNAPQKDIMGWFQIASIHGFPLTAWNGIPGKKPVPNEKFKPNLDGYCPHSLRTFGTWHRPYLVMLEQALFIQMVEIAKEYEEEHVRTSYLEAAQRFRLPYWDYFRPRGGRVVFPGIIGGEGTITTYDFDFSVPRIFTEERLMVRTTPKHKLELIKNPFSNFCFNETNGDLRDTEWTYMQNQKEFKTVLNRERTTRHPWPSNGSPQDTIWDNPQRLNTVLNEMRMDTNRIVLEMLSGNELWSVYDNFVSSGENEPKPPSVGETSQDDAQSPQKEMDDKIAKAMLGFKASVEGVHNLYHIMIGGYPGFVGHMGRVPTAAFDPVFWFHHGQIERILCLWQSINDKEENKSGWLRNQKQADSDLIPFIKEIVNHETHDTQKNVYWTSTDLRHAKETFGYTYDEIKDTPEATVKSIKNTYEWSVPKVRSGKFGTPPDEMKPLDLSKLELFQVPGPRPAQLLSEDILPSSIQSFLSELDDEPEPEALAPDTEVWDWQIGDRVKRLALNGSFSISYYVKNKNEKGGDLYNMDQVAASLAGITYIFASSKEVCSNCATHAEHDRVVQNAVSITSQLIDYVRVKQLDSLHPDHVVPFLKERLRWRIVDVNGQHIDPRRTDIGLELNVLSFRSTLAGELQEVLVHDEIIGHIIRGAGPLPDITIPPPTPQFQIDLWAGIEE